MENRKMEILMKYKREKETKEEMRENVQVEQDILG